MTTGDDGAVKLAQKQRDYFFDLDAPVCTEGPRWVAIAKIQDAQIATLTAKLQAANVELTALREALASTGRVTCHVCCVPRSGGFGCSLEICPLPRNDYISSAALTRTETTDG